MSRARSADPAGLGRGRLTGAALPVFWQAPAEAPAVEPFAVPEGTSPTRFLLLVLFSVKRFTVPAAALGIVWQAGEALVPVVMGVAIDRALATGDTAALGLWLAVLAGVFLSLSLAFRFAAQLTELAKETVQHRLRVTLSRAVLHADGPRARKPDGAVVSLMTNDVTRAAAVGLTVYPVAELAGVGFIAASLLVIYWPLGVAVLAGAPLTVWAMGRLSGRLARDSRVYQTLLADTVGRAGDLVAGYRVIKGVRAEAEAARRYRDASRRALAGVYRNVTLLGRFIVGSNTVSGTFIAAVAGLAGWFAISGQLSIGGLIAAVGLAQALLPPMQMIAMNAVPAWAAATASSARVLDALTDAPTPAPGRPPRESTEPTVPLVELSVARHTELRVRPGEFVGLRADERTAARIAEALLSPHVPGETTVSVDGAGVPDLGTYRSQVVVSPHHAALFSGTTTDNLTAGGTRSRLAAQALRAAACEDFVGTVENGVGELGNRLSGGQRQRLALARALATDAPVLVLHDPTTAVDSVTEQVIASRVRDLRRGRSTILIASAPALLNVCDRIVDLRENHLREARTSAGDVA